MKWCVPKTGMSTTTTRTQTSPLRKSRISEPATNWASRAPPRSFRLCVPLGGPRPKGGMTADAAARDALADRIPEIEEAYEFMLSHAAQGHQRGTEGELIRNSPERADA